MMILIFLILNMSAIIKFCIKNYKKMADKKMKKVTIELSPVQMIWLHSQHLFQKIEQNSESQCNEVKFFKNNSGVEIRFQYYNEQQDPEYLHKAKEELTKIIDNNEIRLMKTSLHKDLYIRISKEARKQFPKSYIIFLHYETFENCCRKLYEKFNITSITPELQRLRKNNPHFCFLIAEKSKIDDIQKFTMRILNSEVSCASTTFSQNISRREQVPAYKRTLSVSSLKGSYLDQNEQQCRLSVHLTVTEQEMFEISETVLVNLSEDQIDKIIQKKKYCGSRVCIQKLQGNYLSMKKKLYYTNRLQLTSSPHIQRVYGYCMTERNLNRWILYFVTDHKYRSLEQVFKEHWFNYTFKIDILIKIGKALIELHRHKETYGDLNLKNVLIDSQRNVFLNCFINKDIPPYTNPYQYDINKYLMLVYYLFTENQLSYEALIKKIQRQEYFCSASHKCNNKHVKNYLAFADQLYMAEITLGEFLKRSNTILKSA